MGYAGCLHAGFSAAFIPGICSSLNLKTDTHFFPLFSSFLSIFAVDSRHLKESIERAEFSLQLELWFGEQNGSSSLNGNGGGSGMGSFSGPASSALTLASTRNLQLNFHPGRGPRPG